MTNNSELTTEQAAITCAAACLGALFIGPLGALALGGVALAEQVINHSEDSDNK